MGPDAWHGLCLILNTVELVVFFYLIFNVIREHC